MVVWINESKKIYATFNCSKDCADQYLKNNVMWTDEVIQYPSFNQVTQICDAYLLDDGSIDYKVINIELTEQQPTPDEIIRANYLETQYQTVLLEMQSGM